jgi:nicotinate-nucleotide adenylyltransferase
LNNDDKKIGLFGGTFNPVHFGHLRAICEVVEGFPLDECYMVPAAIPPHKTTDGVVGAEDRLEMLRLAIADHNDLSISDVELKRPGLSYTIDTVRYIRSLMPADSRLYLIVGIDAFLEFNTWKSYRSLLKSVTFIVISRPGPERYRISDSWKQLKDYLRDVISNEYTGSGACPVFTHPQFLPIYTFTVTMLDISSSKIRNLIHQGRSPRYLLPKKVGDYINARGLYV